MPSIPRDAAYRAYHLVRAVFQVAQVMPAGGIVGEAGLRLIPPQQQRLGDRIGGRSELGHHRVMNVPDAGDVIQRRRALGGHLGGAAQIDDSGQAQIADQQRDVGG